MTDRKNHTMMLPLQCLSGSVHKVSDFDPLLVECGVS